MGRLSKGRQENYIKLTQEIEKMTYKTTIYKVLRDALSKRGYWHRLPRGNPKRGWAKAKALHNDI